MRQLSDNRRPFRCIMPALALLASVGATGCQVHVGGQILPSPYYMSDDLHYFAPGPEFKLAEEAAALQAREAVPLPPPPPPGAQAATRPGWTEPKWK